MCVCVFNDFGSILGTGGCLVEVVGARGHPFSHCGRPGGFQTSLFHTFLTTLAQFRLPADSSMKYLESEKYWELRIVQGEQPFAVCAFGHPGIGKSFVHVLKNALVIPVTIIQKMFHFRKPRLRNRYFDRRVPCFC